MKTKKLVLFIIGGIILLFIITGVIAALITNQEESSLSGRTTYPESDTAEMAAAPEMRTEKTAADTDDQQGTEKKIIKTGSLNIVVGEIDEAVNQITNIATGKQGFVSSSNIYTRKDKSKYGTIVIRVPAEFFEQAMEEIKGITNTVKQESASGRDVTEEFVDLQARLKNLELKEEQYQKIMNRATKIEDVLKASDYLFDTREEIERIEGRIKYLENLTDLSTISIALTEETKIEIPTSEWKPLTVIKNAFRSMIKFWQGIVNILIWIIFLFVPIAIIVWVVYKIVKRVKKKK
ncbi:MAG: DUF4349 domain-containing protein [Atribacterota bacterium]